MMNEETLRRIEAVDVPADYNQIDGTEQAFELGLERAADVVREMMNLARRRRKQVLRDLEREVAPCDDYAMGWNDALGRVEELENEEDGDGA